MAKGDIPGGMTFKLDISAIQKWLAAWQRYPKVYFGRFSTFFDILGTICSVDCIHYTAYSAILGSGGFEPSKAEPTDLQRPRFAPYKPIQCYLVLFYSI
jgi:hypothetical protein